MTGQVKEEVLTRWGELGVDIVNGCASFNPKILKKSEFFEDGTLSFTWCGTPVVYKLTNDSSSITINGTKREGSTLTAEETAALFARNGSITKIEVEVSTILNTCFFFERASLSSRGLGHQVFILVTRVRIPLGMPFLYPDVLFWREP